jgi:hypothetical protein
MEKYKELIETLKQGGRLEVPFDFFIECSFHIMEFWDQITETVVTPTKVDAKAWDVRSIKISEPFYGYAIPDKFSTDALTKAYELHKSIKYKYYHYDESNLTLEKLQEILNHKPKEGFKEITEAGFMLQPYVEFKRGSTGAFTATDRKLKLNGFRKLYDDLKDCECVAYTRDFTKIIEDKNGKTIGEQLIKNTHINFELWRNGAKRFESGHKVAYKLRGEEEYKYLL